MVAGKYDFIVEKGTDWNQTLTLRDSEHQLMNLTGYDARMQIRSSQSASSTILELTVGSGLTLGGSTGTITINVGDSVTSAIDEDSGVYDLELIDTDGKVIRLLEGEVEFKDEVTR